VIPGLKRLEHRRRSGHPAGEQHGLVAVLEFGDERFGLVEGGVLVARVHPAGAVAVVGVAQEGAREVDGRADRAGGFVDPPQSLRGEALGMDVVGGHGSMLATRRGGAGASLASIAV
jgi:hypothetical protein